MGDELPLPAYYPEFNPDKTLTKPERKRRRRKASETVILDSVDVTATVAATGIADNAAVDSAAPSVNSVVGHTTRDALASSLGRNNALDDMSGDVINRLASCEADVVAATEEPTARAKQETEVDKYSQAVSAACNRATRSVLVAWTAASRRLHASGQCSMYRGYTGLCRTLR